jgi:hypothetical protein
MRLYLERSGICVVPLFIGGGMRGKKLEFISFIGPVVSTSIDA